MTRNVQAPRELLTLGPHLIGASGGSGTRVVARIVRHGGLFIGTKLNQAEDAIDFGEFSDRWIDAFVGAAEALPESMQEEMSGDLQAVLDKHVAPLGATAQPWGWKEPRSMYLLPFFHRHFGTLKFLHVVRDGRDIAYSKNQNQLRKHGDSLLGTAEAEWSQPLRSMALWSRINLMRANYGEQNLQGQYLRVRFEDLCREPVPIIQRVWDFFGLAGDAEEVARLEVIPPRSLGRWRVQNKETVVELHRVGGAALQAFGYWMPK